MSPPANDGRKARSLTGGYAFGEQGRRMHVAGIILITAGIACVLASD